MSLAPRFLNEDVPHMVERSLCMRDVRRTMPRFSNFSEESGKNKKIQEAILLDQKKDIDKYVNMHKEGSETVQSLLTKRLAPRIPNVYLKNTSKATLLYW